MIQSRKYSGISCTRHLDIAQTKPNRFPNHRQKQHKDADNGRQDENIACPRLFFRQ